MKKPEYDQSQQLRVNAEKKLKVRNQRTVSLINLIFGANDRHDILLEILCECSTPDCSDKVSLTSDRYREIHGNRRHFVLHPGHEQSDIEGVIARVGNYLVVEKLPGLVS